MIQTWTLDADAGGLKYRVEHPVYREKYLLGFADLIAFYRVRMTFQRQPGFDPSRDDDKPHDRWGAYLVEVKTGSLKAGEAMRQIKAYEGALNHRSYRGAHYRGALKVPGENYWANLHMKSVLIVDNLPAQPVLEAFWNEDIIVYEAGPQYPNFFCF